MIFYQKYSHELTLKYDKKMVKVVVLLLFCINYYFYLYYNFLFQYFIKEFQFIIIKFL
jgi:hypothetical protein